MTQKHHADIQEIIARLDEAIPMMHIRLNGFCLWPSVKVALWRLLTNMYVAETGAHENSLIQPSRFRRLIKFLSVASRSTYYLIHGFVFLCMHSKVIPQRPLVLLYTDRTTTAPNGTTLQSYFGNVPTRALNITDAGTFKTAPYTLAQQYFNARIYIRMTIKLVFRLYDPAFYEAIKTFHEKLGAFGEGCEKLSRSMIMLTLSHFCETRNTYERFFKRIQPRALVVTDFDSVFGAIAAARALGIPTYDMQHGTFWSGDLDHSWTGKAHAFARNAMPFPDKLLVFGPFWKDIALEQGFWRENDILCVGSPVMNKYIHLPKTHTRAISKLLYVTGDIMPQSVTAFISNFMSLPEAQDIELTLRLHPRENANTPWYRDLDNKFGARVRIEHSQDNFLNDALKNDAVIGTATTALIEAALMGCPTISIGAGAIPEGIAAIHKSEKLSHIISHARTPYELLNIIRNVSAPSIHAGDFYTKDFENKFYTAVNS